MDIAKIETFDSNKEWLKTVCDFDGIRAFSDEQINEMTEEEATKIATAIMNDEIPLYIKEEEDAD